MEALFSQQIYKHAKWIYGDEEIETIVYNECFHTIPDVFRKESRKSFREVIDHTGKSYLKISGEAIFKEIQVDVEILGGWRKDKWSVSFCELRKI